MRSAAELHAQLVAAVHAAETAAMRADNDALQIALGELSSSGELDEHTTAFVRQAPGMVIGLAAAFNSVLHTHRGLNDRYGAIGCRECGTAEDEPCRTLRRLSDIVTLYKLRRLPVIDAAEAWRRARAHRHDGQPGQLLTSVTEITDGYVIRHVRLALPDPPAVPDLDTEQVLIVDKRTGKATTSPLMPLATLDTQYQRFAQDQPMTFDTPAEDSLAPRE